MKIFIEPKLELVITCKMEESRILLKAMKVISSKVKARGLKVMCTWSGAVEKKRSPSHPGFTFEIGLTVTDRKHKDLLEAMPYLRRAVAEIRKAFDDFLKSSLKVSKK